MSLAAPIQVEPSNGLLVYSLLVSASGFVLGLVTILVRLHAGQPVWVPVVLLVSLLVAGILDWPSLKLLARPSGIRILEEGLIEFDASGNPDKIKTSQEFHLATMQDQARYVLAPGSLIWPGLFILRLKTLPLHPSMDHQNQSIVSVVIFSRQLSVSNRRALARLLIWAQRKTQGRTLSSSAPVPLSAVN